MTEMGGTPLARFAAMPLRQRAVAALVLIAALLAVTVAMGIDRSPNSGELLPSQREVIDELAADGLCANLQVIVDQAELDRGIPFIENAQSEALIEYTQRAMNRIGCDD